MQNNLNFEINKNVEINKTFRVAKIMADFDLKENHLQEQFKGTIEIPEKWNIGVIVGNSRNW